MGPARFNRETDAAGSKSGRTRGVGAAAWVGLGKRRRREETHVRADKHGGRNFYLDLLYRALPDAWIDRGVEGPD